jgi:hypothetical protein
LKARRIRYQMPSSPSNGVSWRGMRACLDVIDAVNDYEKLAGSSLRGYTFQACYSHAAPSGNTHAGGGAIDTVQLSPRGIRIASSIGFWPFNRGKPFIKHAHWMLLFCRHASQALKDQFHEVLRGGDGLVGNRPDAHRSLRPNPVVYYHDWKLAQNRPDEMLIGKHWYKKIPVVTVTAINRARKGKWVSRYVWFVQAWLRKVGYYKSPLDGVWGHSTQAALDHFRRAHHMTGANAIGPIGPESLKLLHDAAKSKKPISPK